MTRPSLLVLSGLLALGTLAATFPAAAATTQPQQQQPCPGAICGGGGGGSGGGSPGAGDEEWLKIACRIPGAAPATSDDLRFTNIGAKTIPASTPILWQVKQLNQSGSFDLTRPLLPGESIDAPDLLRQALPADTRCLVRLG